MNRTRILLGSILAFTCLDGPVARAVEDVISGAAPAWATATVWSLGVLPGINDNAVINATGVVDLRGSGFNGTVPPNYTEIQDLTFNTGAAMSLINNSTSVNMTLGLNGGRGAGVPLIQTTGDFVYTVTGTNAAATPHTLAFQLNTGGEIRIAGAGRLDFTSVLSEVGTSVSLNKTGTGILNLGAVNLYTGGTTVVAGTLEASVVGALGSGTVTVRSGAQLALKNLTLANPIVLDGGILATRTGDLSLFSGNIALSGDSSAVLRSYSTPASDLNLTISGPLSGSGSLTINGNATNAVTGKALILTNVTNTFGGTFRVAAAQTLRSLPGTTGNTLGTASVNLDGGTLQLRDDGLGDAGILTYGNNLVLQGVGGTVDVDHVGLNAGNAVQLGTLSIGAQTLNATGANGYSVRFSAATLTGAATFNPTTAPVTISGAVSGAFGLTKTGAGNLVLSGANTYTGATRINAGTLLLTGSISTSPLIDVQTGGILDVSGVAGGFILNNTQTLTGTGTVAGLATIGKGASVIPGDATGAGTLTFSNLNFGAVAGDNSVLLANRNTAQAGINVTATDGLIIKSAAGSITVNVAGTLQSIGQMVLVNYEGALGGTGFSAFKLGSLPTPRVIAALVNNIANSSIDLDISGVDFPVWSGALSTQWSTAVLTGNKNWVLNSNNATKTDFIARDNVLFRDSAIGTTVDISVADVTPNVVEFVNNAKNFVITGTKSIAGTGGIIKAGTGTVTISNANSFTGPVEIEGGSIIVAALANNGLNSPLGAGTSLVFNGGTLEFTGTAAGATDRQVTMKDGGGTVKSDNAITLSGPIAGTGVLTKKGNGSLVLSGLNTFSGGILVTSGILKLGSGQAPGGIGAQTTVSTGAAVDVNGQSISGRGYTLVLSGAGTGAPNTGAVINSGADNTSASYDKFILNSDTTIGNDGGRFEIGHLSALINDALGFTLIKTGNNVVAIGNASTGLGGVIIDRGVLQGGNNDSFGTATLIVNAAGVLEGSGGRTFPNDIALNGGVIRQTQAAQVDTYNGNVQLTAASTLEAAVNNTVNLNGSISGASGLTKVGAGIVTLGGGASNVYSGITTINAGTLNANKSPGLDAIPGDLIINAGGRFTYNGHNVSNQIADFASVTLNGGNLGDPASTAPTNPGATDTIANLTINSGAFGSGRNATVGAYTITGLLKVIGGTALAQRGGAINATAVDISTGLVNLDGGSTTVGQESILTVGAGGLLLTGGNINLNAGPSAITATSVGSIVNLGGDVKSTGTSHINGLAPGFPTVKANVDLQFADRIFDVTGTLDVGTAASPVILTNGGLVKTGAGTLSLFGSNTYNGATTVSAGKLVISGAIAGSALIDVKSGATLDVSAQTSGMLVDAVQTLTVNGTAVGSFSNNGILNGTGIIAGGVTVDANGTIAPTLGASSLTIRSGFNLNSGAHLKLELNGKTAVSQYSQLTVDSNVALAGDLQGSVLGFTPALGDLFYVLINSGAGTTTGTLNGVGDGGVLAIGNQFFEVSFDGSSVIGGAAGFDAGGNDLVLRAVPEPGSLTLLGSGALLGLRRFRRRA